jgi:hypothetical protein
MDDDEVAEFTAHLKLPLGRQLVVNLPRIKTCLDRPALSIANAKLDDIVQLLVNLIGE